tara:strand:+ start:826 stop:1281 length:456 start_codon:yes stop_codon:yes gene_type:complete
MYEYNCKVNKVIDGDTVDVDIDLGFGIVLTDERVRIMGIDTPESRTRDKIEKLFGLASKKRLQELLSKHCVLKTEINKDGEDMKGKFGRVLGDFVSSDGRMITEILIEEGHAVEYHGQSKNDIRDAHMTNRIKLLNEGIISQSDIDNIAKK